MKKLLKGICCLLIIAAAYQAGSANGKIDSGEILGSLQVIAASGLDVLESLSSGSSGETQKAASRSFSTDSKTHIETTPAQNMHTEAAAERSEFSTEDETETLSELITDADAEEEERSGIRPEFKQAMDEYEAFFDEYCTLLKKLSENPDNLTLLMDYASFMSQYTDYMNSLDALENEDLTTEELAYYIEATARIEVKLLEAAQYE